VNSALRTRLIVAATRFANEVADAIEEAGGERAQPTAESSRAERPARRRQGVRAPTVAPPISADAQAKADAALERHGLGRRTG